MLFLHRDSYTQRNQSIFAATRLLCSPLISYSPHAFCFHHHSYSFCHCINLSFCGKSSNSIAPDTLAFKYNAAISPKCLSVTSFLFAILLSGHYCTNQCSHACHCCYCYCYCCCYCCCCCCRHRNECLALSFVLIIRYE